MSHVLVLSLHPEYGDLILKKEKQVELRKGKPRIGEGHLLLIYLTKPIQSIVGMVRIGTISKKPLHELWEEVQGFTGGTERDFYRYFGRREYGVAIFFQEVWPFTPPISRLEFVERLPWFRPPQSYLYLEAKEFQEKFQQVIEERSSFRFSSFNQK